MAKAQGRGSAQWMGVGLLLALHCSTLLASAATWTVGGSQGWRIGTNYTAWAAGQSYTTGDVLFFPYAQNTHDVVEVNKADYDACSATGAIATYTDGNTNVTLNSTGTHYYLCSYPDHCTAGMKLAVTVGAGATPAPAPSTNVGTPATAPAPTPATSAPAPTPTSTFPAPAPTPSSTAPAPTPPTSAPAPVPTPATSAPPTSAPPTPLSSPPSVGTPTGTPTPPNSAASLPSASLAGAALWLSAALLAL